MAIRKQRTTTDPLVPVPVIGKDEMNLCELPIAKLGRRDTREIIEFVGEVVKDGQTITQEWVVSGTASVGLPTEFAERVLVALISLAAAQGFQTEKTTFTVYEILKMMGLDTAGSYYQEVTLALQRLHGVTITGKNTWWDNDKKKYRTIRKGFGLIDNYWLESLSDDEDDEDDEENESGIGGYVIWNEWLWASFQAGYIKNINTGFYYGLKNTLARRLYRFLDKRMHYQDSYQIDIFALAARLGMAEYQYPSKVKEKLQPAFDELIARHYLREAEVIKVGKFTRVRFVRNSAHAEQQAGLWEGTDDDGAEDGSEARSEGHRDAKNASEAYSPAESPNARLAALYADYGTGDDLKQTWQIILRELDGTMLSATYQMLADSALLAVEGDGATIAVNAQNKAWIERQLHRKFLNLLSQHLGSRMREIDFVAIG
jgi:plasmid replication initiation protein